MEFEIKNAEMKIDENTFQPRVKLNVEFLFDLEPVVDDAAKKGNAYKVFDDEFEEQFAKAFREYVEEHGMGNTGPC